MEWVGGGEGGGSGSFEIGYPNSRGWNNFGRRWMRGLGGLENWTIFMEVICVSYESCLHEKQIV